MNLVVVHSQKISAVIVGLQTVLKERHIKMLEVAMCSPLTVLEALTAAVMLNALVGIEMGCCLDLPWCYA